LEIYQYHTVTVTFYFHLLEGTAMIVAAVIVKFSLSAYAEKTEEVKRVNEKLANLNQDIDQYNQKLELAVKEKTKELQGALASMESSEEELKQQKTAILNILDDMDGERAKTLIEKEKLSRILQSIGDAVFVVDRDRKIIIFNRVAELVSGFLAGDVVGKKFDKMLHFVDQQEHKPNQTVEAVFSLGKIQGFSAGTILINKEGREIPVSDSAAPILDANGQVAGCIVVFRDVTREREIDRQKTEFVSVASHQLRTPLTSIKWFLEMMIDGDLGKLTAEQLETLKQVFASNERMIDLVNRLLNVSRIESGRVKVEPKPTDLNEIIKGAVIEVTPLANQLQQKLEVKKSDLPVINIDQKLIREVVVNYLSNAIKYTPPGGKIFVSAKEEGAELIVAIKDNGIGIPVEQQTKIFQKFFRAENAVARETEGTGMGLYVCKSIVELSGGRTWFESIPDKGTTFYFSLPVIGSPKIEGEKSLI
jgi:PAS domain S-box-containing protein